MLAAYVVSKHRPALMSAATIIFATALLWGSAAQPAQGVALNLGDIVAVVQNSGNVYVVNPTTGTRSLLSSGGALFNPFHVLVDNHGQIFIPERSGGAHGPGIVHVTPGTGSSSLLSPISFPLSLAAESSGSLIVGNFSSQLFRVDLQTGKNTLLTTLSGLYDIQDIDIDTRGRYVVLDAGGKVARFDPATGQQTIVASGGQFQNPSDLVIRANGDYLVANQNVLLDINPVSGQQQIAFTSAAPIYWLALQDQNTLLYADSNRTIWRLNLLNNQSQSITTFPSGVDVTRIAVYVPEPAAISTFMVCSVALLVRSSRRNRTRKG